MEPMVQGVNEAELLLGLPLGGGRGGGPVLGPVPGWCSLSLSKATSPTPWALCRVPSGPAVFSVPAGRALLDLCREVTGLPIRDPDHHRASPRRVVLAAHSQRRPAQSDGGPGLSRERRRLMPAGRQRGCQPLCPLPGRRSCRPHICLRTGGPWATRSRPLRARARPWSWRSSATRKLLMVTTISLWKGTRTLAAYYRGS
jgi:hypothetical protein